MSFIEPGPEDHAVEHYRGSRKRERQWKAMMSVWMAASGAALCVSVAAAVLDAPTVFVVLLVLLLAVDGFALVFTAECLDRARQNVRSDRAELRSYGLNPDSYHD